MAAKFSVPGLLQARPLPSAAASCQRRLALPPAPADLEGVAAKFNIPFRHLPLAPRDPAAKAAQEAHVEAILEEMGIDLIVLARYMQVGRVSGGMVHV